MRDLGGGYLGIGIGVEGEELEEGSCGGGAEGREENRLSPGSDGILAIVTALCLSLRERDKAELPLAFSQIFSSLGFGGKCNSL